MSVIVVGGTGGIGSAVVQRFAAQGHDVHFSYFAAGGQAETLVAECSESIGSVHAHQVDVTDRSQIAGLVEAAGSSLDTVVYCAASGVVRELAEASPKHLKWTFDVNAMGFFDVYQLCSPVLRSNAGSIVAFSSPGATAVLPDYSLVGPSKAALEGFVRSGAAESGPHGVRVNAISPGAVETKALEAFPREGEVFRRTALRTPMGRLVRPDELANIVSWLTGPEAVMITGQVLVVDGGWGMYRATD